MSDNRRPLVGAEAERALIAALLMDSSSLDEVGALVRPVDFSDRVLGAVLAHAEGLAAAGRPVDVLSLVESLRADGISRIGSQDLAALTDEAPLALHPLEYASMISKAARGRRIAKSIDKAGHSLQNGKAGHPEEVASDLVADLDRILACGQANDAAAIRDVVKTYADVAKPRPAVATGYLRLDDALGGGMERGTMTILAAGPSIGKTQLAANICLRGHGPDRRPIRALFISQEMSRDLLVDSWIAQLARIDSRVVRAIRTGRARPETLEKHKAAFDAGAALLADRPIQIYDLPLEDPAALRGVVARYHRDADLVILDYLQLLARTSDSDDRRLAVEAVSAACKQLAMRYGLSLLVISALSRKGYDRGQDPQLPDLRESGAIDFDADNVLMLNRSKADDVQQEDLRLFIRKQRCGILTAMTLRFDLPTQRIFDPQEEEDGQPAPAAQWWQEQDEDL